MTRKGLLIVLVIASLLLVGCQEEKKTTVKPLESSEVTTVLKDLKGEKLALKVEEIYQQGDLNNTLKVAEAAYKKEPSNIVVGVFLTNAYYFKGDYNSMFKLATELEKKSPNNIIVVNQLAWAAIESGNNPQASVNKLEKQIRAFTKTGQPIDPGFYDTYALGLEKIGKRKQAIEIWKSIISQTEQGEIYHHFIKALLADGKKAEAKSYLADGLKLVKLQLTDANITDMEKKQLSKVKSEMEKMASKKA